MLYKIRKLILLLTSLLLLISVGCAQLADRSSLEQHVEHRYVEAEVLNWHYVEAGEGEPVVFLHGLPESWFS